MSAAIRDNHWDAIDNHWNAIAGFSLRGEAADWLSAFGAILLSMTVFSPLIGPWAGGGFRYVDWWPLMGYVVLALAAVAFFLSRLGAYQAVYVIAICCFIINGLVLFTVLLEVMPTGDPNRLESIQRTYNITQTEARFLGIELKDGFVLAVAGNLALFAGGKLGRRREEWS